MEFKQQLQEYRNRVNQEIAWLLPEADVIQRSVIDAMRYSVNAGGKRLRPVLTLAVCEMLGGNWKEAIPFACAVEFIHASSLIHDDLPCMDDDDLRRGKPSCHVAFGEATALLAGDGLIMRAFEVIGDSPNTHGVSPEKAAKACAMLSRKAGVPGMIGGQIIDLEQEGKQISCEILEKMHRLKTGALIQSACQLGAVAAGAEEKELKQIGEYALKLGLAFQICDDILDVEGDPSLLGKPIGSDAEQNKTTFVTLFGLEGSKKKAAEITDQAVTLIRSFPQSEFLISMTESLLGRKN